MRAGKKTLTWAAWLIPIVLCVSSGGARAELAPPDPTATVQTKAPIANGVIETTDKDSEANPIEPEAAEYIKKYWASIESNKISVAQRRAYPNRRTIEVSVSAGSLLGDPFLSTHTVGGSLGYHIDNIFSVHLTGWGALVTGSSAFTTLETQTGAGPNVNAPSYFLGVEGKADLICGKFALLDKKIFYLDNYIAVGAGRISTLSGPNFLAEAGIEQQIRFNEFFAINLSYYAIWYQDTLLATFQTDSHPLGQNLGRRSSFGTLVSLGVSFFLPLFE
jgi:outer membrane beta-barrel protein